MNSTGKINVSVVVLGDLGRSPRMRYHALALADNLAEVDLIGYAGSDIPRAVREHPRMRCHLMRPVSAPLPTQARGLRLTIDSLLRLAMQAVGLLRVLLFAVKKPDVLLVQNPPAIPTLFVALVVARLRSARLIIDWHNFGYTMLALKLGPSSRIVRWARWYEQTLGRRADGHLCVSRAMQSELENFWGFAGVTVLYDRPANGFKYAEAAERNDLRRRLANVIGFASNEYRLDAPRRPAVLVSPTSWTQDEDFDLFLDAISQCDQAVQARELSFKGHPFPHLLVLLTGDGPLRKRYEDRIGRMTLRRICVQTLWLSHDQYPLLLRAADLGICLHRSSSGLDLPMKVADMLGSGLPVCALDYGPCLAEQLRHGENGLLFSNATELAEQLLDLFKDFPEQTPLLDQLRWNIRSSARHCWSEEWQDQAASTITGRK